MVRDDRLLAYLGIARYASADQLHRLFFDGASKKQTYRRLAKLCEPGGQPGEGPCLRRLAYRRRDGLEVPVWALAPFGRSVASKQVPCLRPPASADIGARFLEHTLVLNQVLASLVAALRGNATEPLHDLPFRWLSEDDDSLGFRRLHKTGVWLQAVLKPDAIMTIPARRRRLFIEAEMGSQSIATANPEKTGAVLSKLDRYRVYFTVRSDDDYGTWYRSAFPDDYEPRIAFLVHSDERRRKVERAVKERLGLLAPPEFRVLILTFAEAPSLLSRYVREGVAEPARPHRERVVRVDEAVLGQVRDGYNAMVEALNACRKVITDHNQRGGPQLQLPSLPKATGPSDRS
jgi:protein involved in plasmid replication-relaxation